MGIETSSNETVDDLKQLKQFADKEKIIDEGRCIESVYHKKYSSQ